MQLENIEEIEENLAKEDEHIINMWTPLDLEIDGDYEYVNDGILFKLFSTILYVIALPIVYIYNKIMYNFKIYGRENLMIKNTGKITVSNHVHPMDCTMNAIANAPKNLYFISIKSNFEIPIIGHIIKLLHAMPIPEKVSEKAKFFNTIRELLNNKKSVHFYPEASLWPYYKKLRKFKNGAFKIAVENNVPVVPMVYKFVKPYGIRKLIKKRPFIELHILKPVYPDVNLPKKESIEELKNTVYYNMKKELEG